MISVHTGKKSKEHKVYRLGQRLSKSKIQIWETLSKKKLDLPFGELLTQH